MITPFDTTVVGSFPVLPFYPVKQDFPPYTDDIPEGELVLDDPFLPGIFEALRMQNQVQIDYPSYGQPQDMCDMFLGWLINHGLEYKNGFKVVGDIEIPHTIPGIEYLQVAQKYFQFKGVRMPLTGPITLAASVKVGEKSAIEFPEIVEKLAEFVSQTAYYYDKGGASIICIDEPSLVYALYAGLDTDFVAEMIDTVLTPIKTAVSSVHVCGQLTTSITDILLFSRAHVLDHEFASIPGNYTMYSQDNLESHKKLLGFGCVETNVEPAHLIEIQKDGNWQRVVEPVDIIKKRIIKAVTLWGKNNLILDPDCGFGGMRGYISGKLTPGVAMDICYQKLKNMVQVKQEIS
jgi:5-methyltetrahydropteroyltriglutamate--homocysteine methyltransferase